MHRISKLLFSTVILCTGLGSRAVHAQETIDLGVIKEQDISVVQRMLYPKKQRMELGIHAGWIPFDPYTTTPIASLTGGYHLRESLGFELAIGGGYGMKNSTYKELEGPAYGVAPDAYRYLGSGIVNAQWSPIYAKLNWLGRRVVHHDVYFLGGAGITMEQAILPDNTTAMAPTIALGTGARLFLGKGYTLRAQIRDDILREYRVKTADTKGWFVKQNVALTIGITHFGNSK